MAAPLAAILADPIKNGRKPEKYESGTYYEHHVAGLDVLRVEVRAARADDRNVQFDTKLALLPQDLGPGYYASSEAYPSAPTWMVVTSGPKRGALAWFVVTDGPLRGAVARRSIEPIGGIVHWEICSAACAERRAKGLARVE